MELPRTCGDCGGGMRAGFIVDVGYGAETVSSWQSGEPQKRWWMMGGIVPSKERMEITTLRCEQCGLLRSYAVAG